MSCRFNFSAGPAMLPEPVLKRIQEELTDWRQTGMSVMELPHRGEHFKFIAMDAELRLRRLLKIPDSFSVLFLQGGASMQFSMVPMNLMRHGTADYVDTGIWSQKAIAEANRFGRVAIAASTKENGYDRVPRQQDFLLNPDVDFVHYTPNETIQGVEFASIPDVGHVPLVADMSSTILSQPLDVSRFGLIYAGAQKNIGPAGLTLVILAPQTLEQSREDLSPMLSYRIQAKQESMYNTPPTFAWYVAGLVFEWLEESGGLSGMAEKNLRKSEALYQVIDQSSLYMNPVQMDSRSKMNVVFTLSEPRLEGAFLEAAEREGLCNLKGHRSVGGFRASLYNAMPEKGVDALCSFMREFERTA